MDTGSRPRPPPIRLEHVLPLVAHHFAESMFALLSCCKSYNNDSRLLRVFVRASNKPRILSSAIPANACPERTQLLLQHHTAEQLNAPLRSGQTVLQQAAAMPDATCVASILQNPVVQLPAELFPEVLAQALLYREHEARREAAASCAAAILAAAVCDPSNISTGGRSNLSLAAEAGLVDVVRRWLHDPRCTAELLQRQDDDGHTAFTRVCDSAVRMHKRGMANVTVLQRFVYCAKLLAWDSRNSPAWTGPDDNTQLGYASALRMADVLRPWTTDSRTTVAVLETPFTPPDGHVAYSLAHTVSKTDVWTPSQDEVRALGLDHPAECVCILAEHPQSNPAFKHGEGTSNFQLACQAGAVDAVSRWLKDPRVDAAVLHWSNDTEDVWADVCYQASDYPNQRQRSTYLQVLEVLSRHPLIDPSRTVGDSFQCHEVTYLAYACWAGAPNFVTRMLADPRCPEFNDIEHRPLKMMFGVLDDGIVPYGGPLWTGLRDCCRLLTRHPSCKPGDKPVGGDGYIEPCNIWYACRFGLDDVVPDLLKTVALASDPSPFTAGCVNKGTLFSAVCTGIADLEWQKTPDKAGLFASYHACAATLAACVDPHQRVIQWNGDDEASRSNTEAPCDAGLVDIVAQWLPSWDPAKDWKTTRADMGCLSETPFSYACSRACSSGVTAAQRKSGADCARLLFASGKIQPDEGLPEGSSELSQRYEPYTAFEAAAHAGLTDIVTAWQTHAKVTRDMAVRAARRAAARAEKLQAENDKVNAAQAAS